MCRLYGFRANQPTKVECTLIHAQNALMIQSRSDMRGVSHTDGWGIAYYEDSKLATVVKRDTAAFQDLHFASTVERVYADTIVAHVRRATVGRPCIANTHPFSHGPWVFAHNGTLAGYHGLAAQLTEETDAELRMLRHGTSDSEAAFYWLLSAMTRAGIDLDARCRDLDTLSGVMGLAVRELAARCEASPLGRETRLNFLLTDGRVMLVSRWNNSLYWVERSGVRDCEICGIPHIHLHDDAPYRAAVVASEPISSEDWHEVPDRHLAVVTPEIEVKTVPLETSSARSDRSASSAFSGTTHAGPDLL